MVNNKMNLFELLFVLFILKWSAGKYFVKYITFNKLATYRWEAWNIVTQGMTNFAKNFPKL